MKLIYLLLPLYLLSCFSYAETPKSSPLELLASAERIESSRIYRSGTPSLLTQAFNEVLGSKSAKEDFLKLFRISKTNAGRLYALTGLRFVDDEQYQKLAKRLDKKAHIPAIRVCCMEEQTAQYWLAEIESGKLIQLITWQIEIEASLCMTADFSKEDVRVYLNDKMILSESLTTDPTIGVAKYIPLKAKIGDAKISVEIPRLKIKKEFNIDLNEGLFIDIGLSKAQVTFNQFKKPLLRD